MKMKRWNTLMQKKIKQYQKAAGEKQPEKMLRKRQRVTRKQGKKVNESAGRLIFYENEI